ELAPALVADAEHAGGTNAGGGGEHGLDRQGVDVLAAGDDHVVAAAGDVQRATGEVAEVGGGEHRGDRCAVEVARCEHRGAHRDRRGGRGGAGLEGDAGQRDQRRVRVAGAVGGRGGELAKALGHAVRGEERDAARGGALEQGGGRGGAAEQH